VTVQGFAPTDEELKQLLAGQGNKITWDTFKGFVDNFRPTVPTKAADDMCVSAFGVLDRQDNGTIQSSELRHILTALGDRLTEEEADHFIFDCSPDANGVINYEKFLSKINKT